MARKVDKTSVREELECLKQDFEQLCSDGKVTQEVRLVMNSLLVVVELMLSVFLEKKTRKDSKNSSLPPSQTDKDKTSTTSSSGKRSNRSRLLGIIFILRSLRPWSMRFSFVAGVNLYH